MDAADNDDDEDDDGDVGWVGLKPHPGETLVRTVFAPCRFLCSERADSLVFSLCAHSSPLRKRYSMVWKLELLLWSESERKGRGGSCGGVRA